MSKSLPELLDPRRAIVSGDNYRGNLPLAGFTRLADLIEPDLSTGQVAYHLTFGRDEEGREQVSGTVRTVLHLRCQRCGQPYALEVDVVLGLAIVTGLDAARSLPDAYDPLLLETPLIRPRELIEDELILAIPAVPRHPEGDCQPPPVPGQSASEAGPDHAARRGQQRPNPFAALAALRTRASDPDPDANAHEPDAGP
ncbi:MAG: hypothetical protein EA400_15945 [Chromatiaceae bacterium]|nr:MAG: hypothetical protein EA400_15945 [Chromatiaceae bacterium]